MIRVVARGVVIQSPDGELEVDLTAVRSVWRETEVAPSELEIGDQLDLSGTHVGATFKASYVWANIGRFDGVVRAFVGTRLELVALPPSTRTFQVELYIWSSSAGPMFRPRSPTFNRARPSAASCTDREMPRRERRRSGSES